MTLPTLPAVARPTLILIPNYLFGGSFASVVGLGGFDFGSVQTCPQPLQRMVNSTSSWLLDSTRRLRL